MLYFSDLLQCMSRICYGPGFLEVIDASFLVLILRPI